MYYKNGNGRWTATFQKKIFFGDKAHFTLGGCVNKKISYLRF